ncbi:MAG: hypothetical protein INQ03_07390 [Candidatus Heimdallarchaeota archaeon]|nr:hypothetical protein [Candidatus Heimdallarchaeota archaeon]
MNQSQDFDELVKIIVQKSGKSESEILAEVDNIVELMDRMVSRDSAIYVVADNLGVNLESDQTTQAFKIDQLIAGASNLSLIARIERIYPLREFKRKDGSPGRVRNVVLRDEGGSVRIALWDNKCDSIEALQLSVGDVIRVTNASSKLGQNNSIELSLGFNGRIDKGSSSEVGNLPEISHAKELKIGEINNSINELSITAKIVDTGNLVTYDRKGETGKVQNITVRDLTGTIQITFWQELVEKITALEIGKSYRFTDLRVAENKYNEIQLTFNNYSSLNLVQNSDLDSIEIASSKVLNQLSDLTDNMNKVSVIGKIIEINDLREFEKNGEKRKVQNIAIMDNSATIRTTFWGEDTDLLTKFKNGDVIQLDNCRSKLNNYSNEVELTFSSNSKISKLKKFDKDNFEFSDDNITSLLEVTEVKRGVSVKVAIARKFDVRDIDLSDRKARVLNYSVKDLSDGSLGKIAAWDENISMIENLEEDEGYLLQNVRVKPGSGDFGPEIVINQNTLIEKLDDIGPIIQTADMMKNNYEKTRLDHLVDESRIRAEATIVNVYPPAFYDGCNECNRKVELLDSDITKGSCSVHNDVTVTQKIIITINLDDGHATVLAKFFNEKAEELIKMTAKEAKDKIDRLSDPKAATNHLIMQDIWVEGKVQHDKEREEISIMVNNFGYQDYSDGIDDTFAKFEGY